jgi:hypothetical protein
LRAIAQFDLCACGRQPIGNTQEAANRNIDQTVCMSGLKYDFSTRKTNWNFILQRKRKH